MRLTPDEYNHKPVLATIFTPNVYDGSVPEGRVILARQELINQWSFQVQRFNNFGIMFEAYGTNNAMTGIIYIGPIYDEL